MKITVINGSEKRGVTDRLKEIFLGKLLEVRSGSDHSEHRDRCRKLWSRQRIFVFFNFYEYHQP